IRSVGVVLPASIWAAMPMLRVRSIGYCRLGEFAELGLAAATVLLFSATASIFSVLSHNENAPRVTWPSGRTKNLTITSENVQMPYLPGPFYALHRACEWHSPALDRPQGFPRPGLLSWAGLYGHLRNRPASARPGKTDDPAAPRAEPGMWRRRLGGPLLPVGVWRCR